MNASNSLPENKSLNDKQDLDVVKDSEESNFAINEFLSLLGHELRTPLAGTMGMLELVLAGDLSADQRSALELANASAQAMLRLVQGMHDLSRIETGRLELEISPFEVRPWIRDITQEIASSGRVKLMMEVDEQMPEILIGDGDRIGYLIMSLVDLILKRSRKAQLGLSLCMAMEESGSYLLVTVGETGIVLEDSERTDLLTLCGKLPFVPMQAFREIGLKQAVVCNLAAALGGALWPAQGSDNHRIQALAVPVNLPTGYGRAKFGTPAEELRYKEGGVSEAHILLVEDDDAIRRLVELLLQQHGWRVTSAADGMQALESFYGNQYDLVLMDIRMPRLDGLETTRRIRHHEQALGRSPLPIIGMTAHAALQDRTMCLEAGMDDHLSKPIASSSLYDMIEKYLAV